VFGTVADVGCPISILSQKTLLDIQLDIEFINVAPIFLFPERQEKYVLYPER
jgi:hypothetical protein